MDQDCVGFLQWALPQLELEWSGFRKVRGQVCKRIKKRMQILKIPDWRTYRHYLEEEEDEWEVLDGFCRVTISRFYRDHYIFDFIGNFVFPKLILRFPGINPYSCISIGCASGEEPYTLAIMWKEMVQPVFPEKEIKIMGIEIDPVLLQRAKIGVYTSSSLRELPVAWTKRAFTRKDHFFTIRDSYKKMVEFVQSDLRTLLFTEPFQLVLCRNLAATYFAGHLQVAVFRSIREALHVGAALVLGSHEKLPFDLGGFKQDDEIDQIYWAV